MKIIKRKILIFLFFLSISGIIFPSYAQEASEKKIQNIDFVQDKKYTVPKSQLMLHMKERIGQNFNEKTLNDDIKRLYDTGYFSDIVGETKNTASGNVNITIKLTCKSIVDSLIFKGNEKFSNEELQEHVDLNKGIPLDDKSLKESLASLRKFYKDEGYGDAVIMPVLKQADNQQVKVIFNIDEKLKLKVNDVNFEGNTVYSDWKLRHSIPTQYSYFNWIFNTGLFFRSQLPDDKIYLRELYWNKGYLDFEVRKIDVVKDKENPEFVDITFHLHEGKTYKVGKITFAGNKRYSSEELLAQLKLTEGKLFDNRMERQDVERIEENYFPYGYANFTCTPKRSSDFQNHTVDIEYNIFEGGIFKVRDVNISGNKITKDKVIRRELVIHPEDPVDKTLMKASKSRLMGMRYFEDVQVLSTGTKAKDQKDINIRVKEKDTMRLRIGGGYSDTDSLVGMLELSQSNFDLFAPEKYFAGGGQRVRLQAFYGIDRYDFLGDFTEPYLFDIPLRFNLQGFIRNVDYEHWKERRIGGTTSLSKKIFDDFTSVQTSYTFEQVKVYDMDDDLSEEFQEQEDKDYLSTLSFKLARDTRDSLIEPTSGYYISGLAEASPKFLGSSNNTYRLESKASIFYSFLDKAIRCHLGAKIGNVNRFGGDHKRVPIYQRYFLGGGDSIRGFPYRSVSPVDRNEDPFGGESMLLSTLEISHPIWNFVRGAVFCDVGNAWKGSGDYTFNELNMGVGYGLRIKLPKVDAPIKLDLAYPVRNKVDGIDNKFRFHFNMGFTF